MAYNSPNRSERLLQGRRFTTNDLTLTQEAFTDVFDLGANEIFTDDGLIPTGSSQLPYSGSSQDGLIISASLVDPTTYTEGSADDLAIVKFHHRKKLKGAADGQREVYYFTTDDPDAHDDYVTSDQIIEADQQTNFVSPKYIIPGHASRNAESLTPGYKVAISYGNDENNVTAATDDQFVFDYKTGVLTWVGTPPHDGNDFVFATAYQYVGRTLRTQIDDGTLGGSGFPFSGSAVITGSLIVSGATSTDVVDFTNVSVISGSTFSGSFVGNGSDLTGVTVDASTVTLGGVLGGTANAATFTNNVLSGSGANNQVAIFNGASELDGSSNLTFNGNTLTAATASITQNLTVGKNLTVTGDLTVSGTTTTINSTEVEIGDRIIVLNAALGGGSGNAGINVHVSASDGNPTAHTGSFLWDDDEKYWKGGELGSEAKFLRETGDGIISGSAQLPSIAALNTFSGSANTSIAALNTKTGSLDSDISTINTSITSLNAKTGSLDSNISTINTSITALNTETGSINTKITALNTKTGSLDSDISTINTSVTALNTKTGSLDSDISTINTIITALNTETGSINASIAALNTKTGSLDSSISNINTSVTALNTKTGSLDSDISTINTIITALNTETGSINTSITALNTKTGSLDSDISTINTSVTALNTKTGSLDTEQSTQNSRLSSIETKTGSLDSDISNINTSVTALNTFTGSAATFTNYTENHVAVFTATTGQVEGSANLTFNGTLLTAATASISQNLTVGGDLTVNGTTTTVNSTEVEIGDNIIILNSATAAANAGIYVFDQDSAGVTGSLLYKYDSNYWMAGEKDSEKRIALFNAANPTNSGFIHLDDSDNIVSVASGSTVGAFLQKTADGFAVSAVIDGGTY